MAANMQHDHQAALAHPALHGLTVLERGWLSANNLLVHAAPDEPGATLIDSGHVNHVDQTVALVRHALAPQDQGRLWRVVNTHLHSDHCGGNAGLQRAFGATLHIPPGLAPAVQAWDEAVLSYAATGQRMERFRPDGLLQPGSVLAAGGRRFEVLAAPGHDPDSVMLWDAGHRLLVSADALWQHGFGVVFPELDGEPGFADVGAVLDQIEALQPVLVVPGHGAPFTDVHGALARARARLAAFQAEPARHLKHGVKVLIKYHLMEVQREPLAQLCAWASGTRLFLAAWHDLRGRYQAPPPVDEPAAWCALLVEELVHSGALLLHDGEVIDT
jgi:glyoxylase-like metal-dependent hydrolase (beta-lactamase superfamily II)